MMALILARFCYVKLHPLTVNVFRDILLGALWASFPLILVIFMLSKKAEQIPLAQSLRNTLINDIRIIFSETKLPDIILISMFAGFAEELLFRGVIQAKLGIIAASVIFGLLHFVTPAYCIIATIMGFYLGFLFNHYESLLVPIQLHFVYDLVLLIYLRYYVRV